MTNQRNLLEDRRSNTSLFEIKGNIMRVCNSKVQIETVLKHLWYNFMNKIY